MGPEALGLSTGPTDLHMLPDGRVLVVSQTELAFGDGVRWETFRSMPDQANLLTKVAVDASGDLQRHPQRHRGPRAQGRRALAVLLDYAIA